MTNGYTETMSKRSDAELIRIITVDKNGYQDAAVQAAESEIRGRGIDFSSVEQIKKRFASDYETLKLLGLAKASQVLRLIHFIIDFLIILIIDFIITLIIWIIYKTDSEMISNIFILGIYFISFFGYYILLEKKFQRTLAKFITKTKVVTENGLKPSFADIIGRTFCRLIPIDCISYLFTSNGFHDRLSGTMVIKE